MEDSAGSEAVLVTGLFGSGKSSVAVEVITLFNDRPIRQVATEVLDRLGWA